MRHREQRDGDAEQTPIVGRPRGPLWRRLQADGVVWEGQVLLVGAEVDLAARVIVTQKRLAFARGGDLVLDVPRAWLQPAPVVRSDGTLLISIRGEGNAGTGIERVPVRMRDGHPATFHLLELLGGGTPQSGPAAAAAPVAAERRPPVLPPLPEVVRGAPGPPRRPTSEADATAPLPVSPLDPFGALPTDPAAAPGTVLEPIVRPAPAPAAIGRDRDWNLQPIRDMVPQARRQRRGWGLRLGGLVLLLAGAYVGISQVPSRPDDRFALDLPAATGAPGTTVAGLVPPTATASATTTIPLSAAEQTAAAVGVGGGRATADAVASAAPATTTLAPTEAPAATETPIPTEPAASTETPVPTETPSPTASPPPTQTPAATATGAPLAAAAETPNPTATPEATATIAPRTPPTLEPEPTATTAPTVLPTSTAVPPAAPTATATATSAPSPTSSPAPTIVPAPTPTAAAPPTTPTTSAPTSTPPPTTSAPTAASATATVAAAPTATATVASSAAAPPSGAAAPTQPPSIGAGEVPAQVVADGSLRYTVEVARRGAPLPEFSLPPAADEEWIALVLRVRNMGDAPVELATDDLTLRDESVAEAVALYGGTGAVAIQLGLDTPYQPGDTVRFDPGQERRLAAVFRIPADADAPTLLIGETALALEPALDGGGAGSVSAAGESAAPELASAIVTGIVDGERIDVALGEARTPVRVHYLGVDAPTGDRCYAAEATAANAALVEGATVWLERQRSDADVVGGLLRDVWIDDGQGGRTLVAARLAAEGAVRANPDGGNVRYAGWIAAAAAAAEAEGLGLWGACPSAAAEEPVAAAVVRPFALGPWWTRGD